MAIPKNKLGKLKGSVLTGCESTKIGTCKLAVFCGSAQEHNFKASYLRLIGTSRLKNPACYPWNAHHHFPALLHFTPQNYAVGNSICWHCWRYSHTSGRL